MEINPAIFKSYDIRGLYPSEINEDIAYRIGRAIAAYSGAKLVVVGRDMRVNSEALETALVNGLADQGADVIRLGLASTPFLYFASGNLPVDIGIIITASHNPAQYNGFKLCRRNAVPICQGEGMEEIRDLALAGNFTDPEARGGISDNKDLRQKYLDFIGSRFAASGKRRLKVVIDFGNGMGIFDKPIYEALSEQLEVLPLFDDYDGNFPNHEANPLKIETLDALRLKVKETGADLGVAYDGDADRVGFVDEQGEIVPMDYVTALLGGEIIKRDGAGLILVDLRSSNAVVEAIEQEGGSVHLCRVGHSHIKKQMREEGAIFAGELSGHYYFHENNNAEMSTLAAVMILNLLNGSGRTMSQLAGGLRKYSHSGEINSQVADKEAVFENIRSKYSDGRLSELDGIRIDYPDWWFNVRASNTEPAIRLNLEAKTPELMESKREEVLAVIRGN